MVHPHAELRHAGDAKGYGLFAKHLIPCGTITYVKDELELVIEPGHPLLSVPHYADMIELYSYIDASGNRIISWDLAKYTNHSCDANTLSTGWGFEIAVRDIHPGEEIVDDYGMFNITEELCCACGSPRCRGTVGPADMDTFGPIWDQQLQPPLAGMFSVSQPLLKWLDKGCLRELKRFIETGRGYRSVSALKHCPARQLTIAKS